MLTRSRCLSLPGPRRHRGLSLVEMLVGLTIGLFVLAAAFLGVTTSLRENRMLLLEARLQQDLRTAMDLVSRDIRRAGYWGNAQAGVWTTGVTAVTANPYATISIMPGRPAKVLSTAAVTVTATNPSTALDYTIAVDANNTVDNGETFNFRLQDGKIQMLISGGTWQDVTDPNTIFITGFTITPRVTWIPLYDQCLTACNPTTQNCPEVAIRSVTVSLTGRPPDASTGVLRTLTSQVRLRNNQITGACPAS